MFNALVTVLSKRRYPQDRGLDASLTSIDSNCEKITGHDLCYFGVHVDRIKRSTSSTQMTLLS